MQAPPDGTSGAVRIPVVNVAMQDGNTCLQLLMGRHGPFELAIFPDGGGAAVYHLAAKINPDMLMLATPTLAVASPPRGQFGNGARPMSAMSDPEDDGEEDDGYLVLNDEALLAEDSLATLKVETPGTPFSTVDCGMADFGIFTPTEGTKARLFFEASDPKLLRPLSVMTKTKMNGAICLVVKAGETDPITIADQIQACQDAGAIGVLLASTVLVGVFLRLNKMSCNRMMLFSPTPTAWLEASRFMIHQHSTRV
jgi:hypothetical protein